MKTVLLLLALLTVTHSVLYCPNCLSFDYSQSSMTSEMKNAMPRDIEGVAHCDSPTITRCESDDMMCNTATLGLTLSFSESNYKFHNIIATEQGCMPTGGTCLQIENLFESIFDAGSGVALGVDSCKLKLCDEAGNNCEGSESGDPPEEITTCPFCMTFDYSAATFLKQHQKDALPTKIEGIASCENPETMACADSNMKCHTAAIRLSMYRNYGDRVDNIQLIEKGCSEPSQTCQAYEKTFEAAWGQQSTSDLNLDVEACAIELCGKNGTDCTTSNYPYHYKIPASNPDTGSGSYFTLSTVLALSSLYWNLFGLTECWH
ncbi:hypothetical protein ACHWQZ_G013603 [Mnemiopsis leidyi]